MPPPGEGSPTTMMTTTTSTSLHKVVPAYSLKITKQIRTNLFCKQAAKSTSHTEQVRLVSVKAECPNRPSRSHARQGGSALWRGRSQPGGSAKHEKKISQAILFSAVTRIFNGTRARPSTKGYPTTHVFTSAQVSYLLVSNRNPTTTVSYKKSSPRSRKLQTGQSTAITTETSHAPVVWCGAVRLTFLFEFLPLPIPVTSSSNFNLFSAHLFIASSTVSFARSLYTCTSLQKSDGLSASRPVANLQVGVCSVKG